MRFAILFLFALQSLLFAQESVSEINRNIKTVKSEEEREKSLMQAEAKRHTAFVESAKQKTAVLEAQEKELTGQIDSLKAEIEKLKNTRQKALGTARYFETRKTKYNEDLSHAIDTLALFVESGFPYKSSEAAENLREISSQLKKNVISAEAAFGRAWEAMMERVRLGYTAETWNGNLELDGKAISGKFFRYGTITSIFASQNGETILWLNSKTAKWENVGENFMLRTALKETMRVAEGKTAPKLSLIPIGN
jgi:molecular chaperone GrpE (heat shock protein)